MREKASQSQQLCGLQGGLCGRPAERLPFISRRRALFKIQSEAASEWQPYFCLSPFTQNRGPGGPFLGTFTLRNNFGYGYEQQRVEVTVKDTQKFPIAMFF